MHRPLRCSGDTFANCVDLYTPMSRRLVFSTITPGSNQLLSNPLPCRCHMCGHDNWQYANTAIFCNFPSAWRLLFTKVAKLYNSQHFQSPSFKLRDQCDAGEVEVVIHSNWPIGSASMAPKLGLASLHNAIQKQLQKLIKIQFVLLYLADCIHTGYGKFTISIVYLVSV